LKTSLQKRLPSASQSQSLSRKNQGEIKNIAQKYDSSERKKIDKFSDGKNKKSAKEKKKGKITDKMIRYYCAIRNRMLTLHILNTNPQKNSSHFTANQLK
jgi:hypothetical protein